MRIELSMKDGPFGLPKIPTMAGLVSIPAWTLRTSRCYISDPRPHNPVIGAESYDNHRIYYDTAFAAPHANTDG